MTAPRDPDEPLVTGEHNPATVSHAGPFQPAHDLPAVPGYRVIREIARGGMGRVLAAYDLTLERDVALKILLPGALSDRFVRESKITARLAHPGIPPIHALGLLPDGSPFLAMKLIDGQTLSAAIKTAKRRQLLQIFEQVCQAVGFAHSRGIVHRDLKPANIMVGAFGEMLVMDWGLAKELDDSAESQIAEPITPAVFDREETIDHRSSGESTEDRTRAGTILGTPAYMAPEAARGEAATKATDIYGLGAILYAVLTGRPPYPAKTAAEVLRQIMDCEPTLFTDESASVPPALQAICRKAMAREPATRYATAEELSGDVHRWLADEPLTAYREPLRARVSRWARRHKTAVEALGVLMLTALIAAVVAAGLIWREEQATQDQYVRAEEEKSKASENADAAIRVVRDLSGYIKMIELSGTRQSVTDRQRKPALDSAILGYERLLLLHPEDQELRATLALACRFRATLCRVLGETAESENSSREALRHYRELVKRYPETPGYQIELALASREYAMQVMSLGGLKASGAILDTAMKTLEENWPPESDKYTRDLNLAIMLLDRAELNEPLGRFAESESNARRSSEIFARLAKDYPGNPEPTAPLYRGMAEIRQAIALRELGRLEEAVSALDSAVRHLGESINSTPQPGRNLLLEYYRACAERGWTTAQMDRKNAATEDLNDAIAGLESQTKLYPQFPANPRTLAMALYYRGRFHARQMKHDAAAAVFNTAIGLFEGLAAKSPEVPLYHSYLGQLYIAHTLIERDSKTAEEFKVKARAAYQEALKLSPENALDRKALTELGG